MNSPIQRATFSMSFGLEGGFRIASKAFLGIIIANITNMKKILLTFILSFISFSMWADRSGSCGKKLKWTFVESSMTLTISGSGEMDNYSSAISICPWKDFRDSIHKVVIEEGVTSIGSYAFYDCSELTSITIPEGVASIGSSAFNGCRNLTSINIPEGVTSIGSFAFNDCRSLTSINIPEGVTSIGYNAFSRCYFLKDKFTNKSVLISNDNWEATLCDEETGDGLLIKDHTIIGCRTWASSVCIPEGVTGIGEYAFFDCRGLTSIIIPNSVISIGEHAFLSCRSLTSVTIPNGVTSIGNFAFNSCGLTSVTIPKSVNTIGVNAFSFCDSLTDITFPSHVINIRYGAFNHTAWLDNQPDGLVYAGSAAYTYKGTMPEKTSITIRQGTQSISDYAFYDCRGLTSIDIPSSVLCIGGHAFDGTTWLNNQPRGLVYAGKIAYLYKGGMPSNSSITIKEGTVSISDYAFRNCSSLTSITIPESVTSIGCAAFEDCSSLTSVTIPESVTSIGVNAFCGCI